MTDPRFQMVWAAAFEREFARQHAYRTRVTQDAVTKTYVFTDVPTDLDACRSAGDRAAAACTEALEKAPR